MNAQALPDLDILDARPSRTWYGVRQVNSPDEAPLKLYPTRDLAEHEIALNRHNYPTLGPWRVIELRQVATRVPDVDAGFDAFRAELGDRDELLMRGQYLAERGLETDYEAWLFHDVFCAERTPVDLERAA